MRFFSITVDQHVRAKDLDRNSAFDGGRLVS